MTDVTLQPSAMKVVKEKQEDVLMVEVAEVVYVFVATSNNSFQKQSYYHNSSETKQKKKKKIQIMLV